MSKCVSPKHLRHSRRYSSSGNFSLSTEVPIPFLSTILFYAALPLFYAERVIHKKSAGWKEKFGNSTLPFNHDKIILMHGVSVGEVIALENLAKKIKETFPDYKLIVTTGTKTGQEIAHKKYENIADFITYFPFYSLSLSFFLFSASYSSFKISSFNPLINDSTLSLHS